MRSRDGRPDRRGWRRSPRSRVDVTGVTPAGSAATTRAPVAAAVAATVVVDVRTGEDRGHAVCAAPGHLVVRVVVALEADADVRGGPTHGVVGAEPGVRAPADQRGEV